MVAEFDVAVIGSGPAGCATAIMAARNPGTRVCLIDPDAKAASSVGETLPPDVRGLLYELGLWEAMLEEEHERCLGSCSAWGSDVLGHNDFVVNPYAHGWHLDRARFDRFLRYHAACSGTTVLTGKKLVDADDLGADGYRLWLARDGAPASSITARYVVDATGIHAAFARRMGARVVHLDRLTFVYGFFDAGVGSSVSRMTMLEATESGWWYAARVPDDRVAVAFATDAEEVRRAALVQERHWIARLRTTRHIEARLEGCRFIVGSLVVRPGPTYRLDQPAGRRWLAVGDAACAYDPLAGQGIYKALADGIAAAKTLASALEGDADLAGDFANRIDAAFEEYRANRNYFYAQEQRWPTASFWWRRHERTGAALASIG